MVTFSCPSAVATCVVAAENNTAFPPGRICGENQSKFTTGQFGYGLGRPSTSGDPKQARLIWLAHDDAAVLTPTRAADAVFAYVPERHNGAATHRDLAQLVAWPRSRSTAHPAKRTGAAAPCVPRQLGGLRVIQAAGEQRGRLAGCVDEPRSVGRNDDRSPKGCGHRYIDAQIHVQPYERMVQRLLAAPRRPQCDAQRDGQYSCRNPGQLRGARAACGVGLIFQQQAPIADRLQATSLRVPFSRQLRRSRCTFAGTRSNFGSSLMTDANISDRSSPSKQPLSRQHLVQHHAESPDVGAPIHLFAARLFRRHVGRRAQNASPRPALHPSLW